MSTNPKLPVHPLPTLPSPRRILSKESKGDVGNTFKLPVLYFWIYLALNFFLLLCVVLSSHNMELCGGFPSLPCRFSFNKDFLSISYVLPTIPHL